MNYESLYEEEEFGFHGSMSQTRPSCCSMVHGGAGTEELIGRHHWQHMQQKS